MTKPMTQKKPAKSTRERLEKRKKQNKEHSGPSLTFSQRTRGLLDALVFAFVLAMFIRSFVFELFIIPTGSMTPTLIGDSQGQVAFADYDGDGVEDVIYTFHTRSGLLDALQVFLMREDGSYRDQFFIDSVDLNTVISLRNQSPHRKDMIIVNKFAYWFSPPERGDIAVFKVPDKPAQEEILESGLVEKNAAIDFEIEKPVYIKRVVGLPGETVTFIPTQFNLVRAGNPDRYGQRYGGVEIHLDPSPVHINGEPLNQGVFKSLIHYPTPLGKSPGPSDPINVKSIPENGVLMVGDNSRSSSDGRVWGHVPLSNMRGKAVLRYIPVSEFGFLH